MRELTMLLLRYQLVFKDNSLSNVKAYREYIALPLSFASNPFANHLSNYCHMTFVGGLCAGVMYIELVPRRKP